MKNKMKRALYGSMTALALGAFGASALPQTAHAASTSDGAVVKKVIDISEWQGAVTYKKALALKSETSFVIVRVQYGSNYKDAQYKNTIANLEKAGTSYGVYSYSRYVNASDAKQEAKDLHSRAPHAKFFVNDAEEKTTTSGSYSSAVSAWGKEMQSLTERPVILYSGSYFYNNYIGSMSNYDAFWEANYSSRYLKDPALWQYTDSGYSTSLSLGVDTNKVITAKHPVKWWIGDSAANKQAVSKYYVGGFKIGDNVKINSSVAKWDDGDTKTAISSSVLHKTYTVGQIKQVTEGKSNQMLLLKSGNTSVGWTLAEHVTKQASSKTVKSSTIHKASSKTVKSSKSSKASSKRVVGVSHTYHKVVSGDSLWKIAKDNGTTISKLTSLNGIRSGSTIYPGQRLKVR